MGGLGHYLEEEGIATTQISLVREHTVKIRPPRALWVPFDLGRPLGVPENVMFQRKVLLAALQLLEAVEGPVLVEFPEDAPETGDMSGWICPVDLQAGSAPVQKDNLQGTLSSEIADLAPWYDLAVKSRGRTTVGVTGLKVEEAGQFIISFLGDQSVPSPVSNISIADALNLACEDVKAYYLEAVTARSGKLFGDGPIDWFWGQTIAGKLILDLKRICLENKEGSIRLLGDRLLVPMSQVHRVR